MSDTAQADVLKRLACVRGHVEAIAQMVERGADDLAVAHQLRAVRGAMVQIQVRLLRAQIDRWANQAMASRPIASDLNAIVKIRKR
jgi:DNA-binding FrmR family transcriptional regulator